MELVSLQLTCDRCQISAVFDAPHNGGLAAAQKEGWHGVGSWPYGASFDLLQRIADLCPSCYSDLQHELSAPSLTVRVS